MKLKFCSTLYLHKHQIQNAFSIILDQDLNIITDTWCFITSNSLSKWWTRWLRKRTSSLSSMIWNYIFSFAWKIIWSKVWKRTWWLFWCKEPSCFRNCSIDRTLIFCWGKFIKRKLVSMFISSRTRCCKWTIMFV